MRNFLSQVSLLFATAVAALFLAGGVFVPLIIDNGIWRVVFSLGVMSLVYGCESIMTLGLVTTQDHIRLFSGSEATVHDMRAPALVLWVMLYGWQMLKQMVQRDKAEQDARMYPEAQQNTQRHANDRIILGLVALIFVSLLHIVTSPSFMAFMAKNKGLPDAQRMARHAEAVAKNKMASASSVTAAPQPKMTQGSQATSSRPLRADAIPQMVTIPSGTFIVGSCRKLGCLSPPVDLEVTGDDFPQHQVHIAAFELGKTEVTVGQFAEFVRDTAYRTDAERNTSESGCRTWGEEGWAWQAGFSWHNPGFAQDETHPVVCISQNDAEAYMQWLSQKTGQHYRLPDEYEWEYAARGGKTSTRYWGDNVSVSCRYANVADQIAQENLIGFTQKVIHPCTDQHVYTAPVGSYLPNAYQLHDMLGNVWEWTGSGIARGGGWLSSPQFARAASRSQNPWAMRNIAIGFRVARSLPDLTMGDRSRLPTNP